MVCIYCKSKTQVTNSRPQKRLNHIWRRRSCLKCGAVFTSTEKPDLFSSLRVLSKNNQLIPFEKERLFISIFQSLGHRKDALAASVSLTDTITAKLLKTAKKACISRSEIISITYDTLNRFDKPAAVHYRAYNKQ